MSVRLQETKVEPEAEQILEAAHVTLCNLQPIRLIAVQSEEGRNQ